MRSERGGVVLGSLVRGVVVGVLVVGASTSRASVPQGDLVLREVDVSEVAWDCASGVASGRVTVGISWRGDGPLAVAPDVLVFEDVDRSGAFEAHVDRVLCETVSTSSDLAEADLSASCLIAAPMEFAGAHVSAAVDPRNLVAEHDESNNVTHSGFTRQLAPAAISWDLGTPRKLLSGEFLGFNLNAGYFTDDDGNGILGQGDLPKLVALVSSGDYFYLPGQIAIVDPINDVIIARSPIEQLVNTGTAPALADLDGNGLTEVVAEREHASCVSGVHAC